MQTNTANSEELADLLSESKILSMDDFGGMRQYVLQWNGQDILAFAGMSGSAFIVYPPQDFDAESGGSVHDHARAILNDAAT